MTRRFESFKRRVQSVPGVNFTQIVAEEYGAAFEGWAKSLPDKLVDKALALYIHTLLLVYSHIGDNKSE